jgi:hypothetical protein
MKPTLAYADFERAATALSCEVAAIQAVCAVEAPKGGFLPDGRPTILFERHKFHQFTKGRWSALQPGISNPVAGGYGASGKWQYDRLGEAALLDRDAALKSASWGKFQLMGFNHAAAGHATLQSFINAMYDSEGRQLDAFVAFILATPALVSALRRKDWTAFAKLYNGPNFAINAYDKKMAAAYREVAQ